MLKTDVVQNFVHQQYALLMNNPSVNFAQDLEIIPLCSEQTFRRINELQKKLPANETWRFHFRTDLRWAVYIGKDSRAIDDKHRNTLQWQERQME